MTDLIANEEFQVLVHHLLIKSACEEGNNDKLGILLELHSIDISGNDNELFQIACKHDHKETILFLLAHPDFNQTPGAIKGFHTNIQTGTSASVILTSSKFMKFVKNNDENFNESFHLAVKSKNYDVIDFVLKRDVILPLWIDLIFDSDDSIIINSLLANKRFANIVKINSDMANKVINHYVRHHSEQETLYKNFPDYVKEIIDNYNYRKKKCDIIFGFVMVGVIALFVKFGKDFPV